MEDNMNRKKIWKPVILVIVGLVMIAAGVISFSRSAAAATGTVVVLCSSCSYPGLPQEGHLVLLDQATGDVWIYSDAAMAGTAKPILWGRLTLGQPVRRAAK